MSGTATLSLRLDGFSAHDLLDDLIELEVSSGVEGHPRVDLRLVMRKRDDGSWTYLDPGDQQVFALWQRLTVRAGFGSDVGVVFDGYVSAIRPQFDLDEAACSVQVHGLGASWPMDQEEKVVSWPDRSVSQVATAIIQAYGLRPRVTATAPAGPQDEALLVQRGTDWGFLRQLARRVGFQVYVEGADVVFGPPDLDDPAQPDLAIHFGPTASNLAWFAPAVRAGGPLTVRASRVDHRTAMVQDIEVTDPGLAKLAHRDGAALIATRPVAGIPTARLPGTPVASQAELVELATASRREADWLAVGEGELDGDLYGHVLRAGRLVNIKGVGESWSGRWYVTRVDHTWKPRGYTARFAVARNGLGLRGNETFQSVTSHSGAAPAAGQPQISTASAGKVVQP